MNPGGDPAVAPHPPPHAEGRQPGQRVATAGDGKPRGGEGRWHLPFGGHPGVRPSAGLAAAHHAAVFNFSMGGQGDNAARSHLTCW